MAWRKWLVRSLVFTVAGGVVVAAFAYQHWTQPAIVRAQVIAHLEELLPKAQVILESARLQLLGGISFEELHLARRDDPNRTDFIYVPKGTLHLDKEALLSGKQPIRQIDWYRPILHLIRNPDGAWNVDKVLAPPTPKIAIPIIKLQDATLVIEDKQACADAHPLEIRDVNLVIMNDPHSPPAVSQLTFEGTGVAALVGKVQVKGTRSRLADGELTASIRVPQFPVDASLVQQLSKFCPELAVHARHLSGTGSLQAEISYHPERLPSWRHDVHWQLTQGKFRHAKLPFPLDQLEASVRCVDGQITLEHLAARSGSAHLQLSGKALAPSADTDILDGKLKVEHLLVSKELFEALPPNLQEIERDYAPQGAFNLAVKFSRRALQWTHTSTVALDHMTGVCAKFPYRLEQITGTIEQTIDPGRSLDRLTLDLVGYAGSRPVTVQGEVEGEKPASVKLRITATDLPIDDKLCEALRAEQTKLYQKVVRPFHPRGYVDIEADVYRAKGERRFANQYVLHFHDASVAYEVFPYPLENVSGTLTIAPDQWEYRGFRGTHKGGVFHSHGKPIRTAQGNRVKIEIAGTNVLLDSELRAALKRPALETAWKKLDPGGRMDFEAQVEIREGPEDPDIEVTVVPQDCTLKPEFFPYALSQLRGTVHYGQHQVKLQNLSARHGQTEISLLSDGEVLFHPDGSFSVTLNDLLANPLIPDAEFIRALPPALGKACASLGIKEPLSLRTKLTVAVPAGPAPPLIQWDGGVRLKDATLLAGVPFERVNGKIWCWGEHKGGSMGNVQGHLDRMEATVFKQALHEINSQIVVDGNRPDSLVLPNLNAKIYGGVVGGAIRVDFGPSVSYEADLNALQIQLDQLSLSNHLGPSAQQSGLLDAHLTLKGEGTELGGLKGWGSIDVPNGKMGNLPLLLDLLKVLALRFPDRTFFEEAHARFNIVGSNVEITRIDLLGAAISLGGTGTVTLDNRTYNMELYAVWGRIVQLSPAFIKEVWPKLSKELLKIRMNGKIGEKPRIEREPVPALTEPFEKMRERISGKHSG